MDYATYLPPFRGTISTTIEVVCAFVCSIECSLKMQEFYGGDRSRFCPSTNWYIFVPHLARKLWDTVRRWDEQDLGILLKGSSYETKMKFFRYSSPLAWCHVLSNTLWSLNIWRKIGIPGVDASINTSKCWADGAKLPLHVAACWSFSW